MLSVLGLTWNGKQSEGAEIPPVQHDKHSLLLSAQVSLTALNNGQSCLLIKSHSFAPT